MGKLNPEFKEKWIAALLSGEYQQGVGFLRNKDSHCCLGVAADLYDNSRWMCNDKPELSCCIPLGSWSYMALGVASEYGEPPLHPSFTGIMPDDVRDEIGLTEKDQLALSYMNDNGKTFQEIADWIRDNL